METNDPTHSGKQYHQVWNENMRKKSKPKIKTSKGVGGWTRIIFTPDWSLFKMPGFDDDILALFKKRVYDMAGTCTPKGLKVYFNGERLEIKDFKNYCQMFLERGAPLSYCSNDRYVGVSFHIYLSTYIYIYIYFLYLRIYL